MATIKVKGDTFTINGVEQCIVHEFDTKEYEQWLDRMNKQLDEIDHRLVKPCKHCGSSPCAEWYECFFESE